MNGRAPAPCDVPDPGHDGEIHFYVNGWKCDAHSPWAVQGQDRPEPGPGLPAGAWSTPSPLSDSRVHDDRAVASGKRRAPSFYAYCAAQAAVNHENGQS
ncbi:hypothetical protein [Streptomyces griseoviridis]|uniref:Chitin-binding type-3 domain-containing protein n=1 Tax=Streptomyces griseoviridis TaxID=45398 RepID=A0ABT9LF94_STRGD|nr:hypothetical protein [Streptomyces griseoviridis]MDP9682398.1 hypothetical protein [Streptomyces griseoviridis]GGS81758.1 hypothetical protein GCM10010240_13890 [Streptomyces griseoviridis]